jgi:hypothetical protein
MFSKVKNSEQFAMTHTKLNKLQTVCSITGSVSTKRTAPGTVD